MAAGRTERNSGFSWRLTAGPPQPPRNGTRWTDIRQRVARFTPKLGNAWYRANHRGAGVTAPRLRQPLGQAACNGNGRRANALRNGVLTYSSRGLLLGVHLTRPADAMGIETPEERVLIALVRAAWAASARSDAIVRKAGLSPSQYNVLRILRHAGGEGLSRNGIGERMVTRDPDLTRILSGLTRMRAVTTRRSAADRRSRVSVITDHGRMLLGGLDKEVRKAAIASLRGLSAARMRRLEALLEAVRPETDG